MVGAVLYVVLFAFMRALRRKHATAPRGLCAGCAFVHMQYAVSGRNAVFCTFGGGVRAVQIDVMYCTDYRDRSAPPRVVSVGFVREIAPVEAAGWVP
jgi:hypothetical protein